MTVPWSSQPLCWLHIGHSREFYWAGCSGDSGFGETVFTESVAWVRAFPVSLRFIPRQPCEAGTIVTHFGCKKRGSSDNPRMHRTWPLEPHRIPGLTRDATVNLTASPGCARPAFPDPKQGQLPAATSRTHETAPSTLLAWLIFQRVGGEGLTPSF